MATGPEPLSAREEIWRGLLLGQRALLTRLAGELKTDFGLSVAAYEALLSLWEAPDHHLRASDLAHSLVYSSGSASHLIRRLADDDLVTRQQRDDDARVIEVALTERGLALIARATAAHRASIVAAFEPLVGDDEVGPLLTFARRLASDQGVASAP